MVFIDESGDDGNTEKSSGQFFVVSILFGSLTHAKMENINLRKILNYKKSELKWNKLSKEQKSVFRSYSKKVIYKWDYIYVDKNRDKKVQKYYDLILELFLRHKISIQKKTVLYKGEHLIKMFSKVAKELSKRGVKISHREIRSEEVVGIEIADLWAGFIHSELRK